MERNVREEFYVRTDEIKQAVEGQEHTILHQLGISWSGGRGVHIHCPYPGHSDRNPSWRWDDQKKAAVCTCENGGYHNIFTVTQRVRNCSFDESKLFAAESLGLRERLFKKVGGYRRFGGIDYYLKPPEEQSNPHLPRQYLAHRLGIKESEVLIPTTKTAGWKQLPYHAPPQQKGGKPVLIGQIPCAVFETINTDGRRHGIRIYTKPNGQGKAELDGLPVKKVLPRQHEEESTSGCSVFWGSPSKAETIILCEGIETAAAIAQTFLKPIAKGQVSVAASIGTAGLSNFQPWPSTKSVIVGADRDENGAGERAARKFCLQNHKKVDCSIALPTIVGDWLDVFTNQGEEAVRDGIDDTVLFQPSQEELTGQYGEQVKAEKVREYKLTYPLPTMLSSELSLQYVGDEIMVHKSSTNPDGPETWHPISSPFSIYAKLRYTDRDDFYGIRVLLEDAYGKPCKIDFDRSSLARSDGAEIRAQMYAAGFRTDRNGDTVVVDAIKAFIPEKEIIIATRPGWHDVPSGKVFITPIGEVIRQSAVSHEIELARKATLNIPDCSGTLDGWKRAVSAAISVNDCPHWTIGILAGFVGPILSLIGLDTCGVNISGFTSKGKTTAQKMAVSAWSSPDIGKGLLRTFRTTDNAIESLAQQASGTILALDDLSLIEGPSVAKLLYMLSGDGGKTRMKSDATLRPSYQWKTFALFSGEKSLEEKVVESRGTWLPGMAVRFPDVDVSDTNDKVQKDTLKMMDEIRNHHGHAGPEFCRRLLMDKENLETEHLLGQVDAISNLLAGPNSKSHILRATLPFSLLVIAGRLAKQYGILPPETQPEDVVGWAWLKYLESSDIQALNPEEQAIDNIREWILERWNVTIFSVEESASQNNRKPEGWYRSNDAIWIPTKHIRDAAGGGLKQSHIVKILQKSRMLAYCRDEKRMAVRDVPGVGKINCYALRYDQFCHQVAQQGQSQSSPSPTGNLKVVEF